ncbi:MAG: hypothetical protein ACXAB9_15585 [Candidatus Thorarchaeota archaeon]
MIAIHLYYDGCNGLRTGETYQGSVEEIAEIVVEHHQNNYATYDKATKRCSPWTKEAAVQERWVGTGLIFTGPPSLPQGGEGGVAPNNTTTGEQDEISETESC